MAKLILHNQLPADMRDAKQLPGVQPVKGEWLRIDEAYAEQMAHRIGLLDQRRRSVLWLQSNALAPAQELLDHVLVKLEALGFVVRTDSVICPDGRRVRVDRAQPLDTLGRLVQCDFCLLDRGEAEHVLRGAVLCFPASWRLSEKAGHPLTHIHDPVAEYDAELAKRVQRLFDGVQVGRPLWRFNQLWYADPELHQPRSAAEPQRESRPDFPYFRAERQTILRLPETKWVVFAIHTYVLRAEAVKTTRLQA